MTLRFFDTDDNPLAPRGVSRDRPAPMQLLHPEAEVRAELQLHRTYWPIFLIGMNVRYGA